METRPAAQVGLHGCGRVLGQPSPVHSCAPACSGPRWGSENGLVGDCTPARFLRMISDPARRICWTPGARVLLLPLGARVNTKAISTHSGMSKNLPNLQFLAYQDLLVFCFNCSGELKNQTRVKTKANSNHSGRGRQPVFAMSRAFLLSVKVTKHSANSCADTLSSEACFFRKKIVSCWRGLQNDF